MNPVHELIIYKENVDEAIHTFEFVDLLADLALLTILRGIIGVMRDSTDFKPQVKSLNDLIASVFRWKLRLWLFVVFADELHYDWGV